MWAMSNEDRWDLAKFFTGRCSQAERRGTLLREILERQAVRDPVRKLQRKKWAYAGLMRQD